MNEQQEFDRLIQKYPHPHSPLFFQRPHWTRRQFFELAGAGVTGFFLARRAKAAETVAQFDVTPQDKAKNVIFILLAGAPSHIDTFDFKNVPGVTPSNFNPESVNGTMFPTGLLPKMVTHLSDIAIVRSMRAWAAVHQLAQTWAQIGRNPAAALGDIAPNIGSIASIEKDPDRSPTDVLPTFLALTSPGISGQGYLSAKYAPFRVDTPAAAGLANSTSTAIGGPGILSERFTLLHSLDDPLRINSPLGRPVQDMDVFYSSARAMIDNPIIGRAFTFTQTDSARYGGTTFGNACLVAKQALAASGGTHYVQISLGGWDMHSNIYAAPPQNGLYRLGKVLDDGLSTLLDDLKSSGLFRETLVVAQGEFGRTVGPLTGQQGRDHFLQQFVIFAGAGVKGGKIIGATNEAGSAITDFGWSRNREVRPEDIEATIYSALGINWTKIRYDDPFGRGFEYVPYAKEDIYGPINELWA